MHYPLVLELVLVAHALSLVLELVLVIHVGNDSHGKWLVSVRKGNCDKTDTDIQPSRGFHTEL